MTVKARGEKEGSRRNSVSSADGFRKLSTKKDFARK
jgi:hypothetical protein